MRSPAPSRRSSTRALLCATSSLFGLLIASTTASAQSGLLSPIILTNQPLITGAPVETLSSFFLYDISPTGQIAYRATIGSSQQGAASDQALMTASSTLARSILVREGFLLPRGGTVTSFGSNTISASNRISSILPVTGSTATQTLTSIDNGVLTELMRNVDIISGTTTISNFNTIRSAEPGLIFTAATLAGPSVTASNSEALIRHRVGSSPLIVARQGSAAPNGGTFGSNFDGIASDEFAYYAFQNTLTGVANPSRYFRFQTNVEEIVAEGTPVPSSGTLGPSFSASNINSLGQLAFINTLNGTTGGITDNEGVYRAVPGELTQIARKGQSAPGGGTITDIFDVHINNTGRVAIGATQTGSPGATLDGDSIFTGTGGTLTRLVREGQTYAPSGGTEIISGLSLIAYNDAGVALLSSNITVPGSGITRSANVLTDGIDTVEAIRSGQSFSGSTIGTIFGNGGSRRLLPDGRVVSWISLADARQAVVEFVPSLRYRSTFSSSWDTASNWTLSLPPSAALPVRIDPTTSLTVTGPTGPETVLSLQIGGGTGNATLRLAGGNLSVTNGTTILATGFLSGEGQLNGTVTNFGTITPTNIILPTSLSNRGLIRGSTTGATLITPLTNAITGEIRVAPGESLTLAGLFLTNDGQIEALGNASSAAQIEFNTVVTNSASTGFITARNAALRFSSGLTNRGGLALTSGTNDVFGDIFNIAGATLTVTGGAHTTFYDDVTQNGTLRVVRSGSTTSVAVFLGAFSGAGGATGGGDIFLEGDLRPGNSPAFVNFDANLALGPNSTTLIEIAGTADASYDRVTVNGILNLAGTLDVRFIDGFLPTGNAPTTFLILSATSLTGDFSQTLLPTAGDRQWFLQRTPTSLSLSSFNVIPEPTSLALLALPPITLLRLPRATSRGRQRRSR